MIPIVDTALARRAAEGRPVRVGMVGAGAMGRGVALQVSLHVPGMEIVAISNRTLPTAERAYREAGREDVVHVDSVAALDRAIAARRPAITDDPGLICAADGVDVVFEVTGTIEFGARVVLDAIAHGKHVVTMNAELQGTLGPILKQRADAAGVVFTDSEGDQPGVIMNLHRFVTGIGVKPALIGNLKGLHDPYRNPTTQEGFAKAKGLTANMATSFADGTKISYEMAIVANATGVGVARRGAYGPDHRGHVSGAVDLFPVEEIIERPIVDYVVGAEPAPGVFIYGTHDHPTQVAFLELYKLGDGPLYTFYTPYHLCHFEVPSTLARAALFQDPVITPLGAPVVDVVTAAKRDLKAGEVIDGIGFYMTYGLVENAPVALEENLLPNGLAEGCVLRRDVPKDQVLTYDDVELPAGRLADELRAEQRRVFAGELGRVASAA
jgi:predicted homoserine dehydrogenase-like protein